ncbi:aspartate-semialdehyde dehydrogenase [bacterium]|jgi:aspartate-semialdehyde dehydrogenase|nr:aspartate-semialdehyde dehydrogenase [bacterium]
MKKYNVAVVGATGVVGTEIIKILEERKFPIKTLYPLASERSEGAVVAFNEQAVRVKNLATFDFNGIDFALFSAGGSISAEFAPKAANQGAIVIDNTSHFRMEPDVPLVVPEVNPDALKGHKNIIANPNCSTAQMVLVLKPIHDAVKIKRVVVSTYQSVSGAGKDAVDELEDQTRKNLNGKTVPASKFPTTIAFNVIPQIDVFLEDGYTKEEEKMIEETKKILGDESIRLTATAVRVPVFVGHSESINIETERKISPDEVRALLSKMPGVKVLDDPKNQKYPTPRDTSGDNDVYVGRIREDRSCENGIELWCVGDNLRKGAALNAVQIAEELAKLPVAE